LLKVTFERHILSAEGGMGSGPLAFGTFHFPCHVSGMAGTYLLQLRRSWFPLSFLFVRGLQGAGHMDGYMS
jgi:hypothetical protein